MKIHIMSTGTARVTGNGSIILRPEEQRELLEALARAHGYTLTTTTKEAR